MIFFNSELFFVTEIFRGYNLSINKSIQIEIYFIMPYIAQQKA